MSTEAENRAVIAKALQTSFGGLLSCAEALGVDLMQLQTPDAGDPDAYLVLARGGMAYVVKRLIDGLREFHQREFGAEYVDQDGEQYADPT